MNKAKNDTILIAIQRVFTPLVRILLRADIAFGTISDLLKWVYVDVAMKEFSIKGRNPSISRVAIITGISRKEVKRLSSIQNPTDNQPSKIYNRAARVITGWQRDIEFLDSDGNPSKLPINGSQPNFNELVKRFSGDVPVKAILNELTIIGAIRKHEDGCVSLLLKTYTPELCTLDKVDILDIDIEDLTSAITSYIMTPNRKSLITK